jgi:hypothetical protein
MRRRFLGRFLLFVAFVVVVVAGLSAVVGRLVFGTDGPRGRFVPLGLLVLLVVVLLAVRTGRRFAGPPTASPPATTPRAWTSAGRGTSAA